MFKKKYKHYYLMTTIIISMIYIGCGVYTFNGSTLPSYIKSIDIPLFKNNSLEPGIADELTQDLSKKIVSDNQLRVISDRGDATINGEVTSYINEPYTFGTSETRKIDVDQYIVRISTTVDFIDNKKDKSIFQGAVSGDGIYDFERETELTGRERAKQELIKKILEKSIQSW